MAYKLSKYDTGEKRMNRKKKQSIKPILTRKAEHILYKNHPNRTIVIRIRALQSLMKTFLKALTLNILPQTQLGFPI